MQRSGPVGGGGAWPVGADFGKGGGGKGAGKAGGAVASQNLPGGAGVDPTPTPNSVNLGIGWGSDPPQAVPGVIRATIDMNGGTGRAKSIARKLTRTPAAPMVPISLFDHMPTPAQAGSGQIQTNSPLASMPGAPNFVNTSNSLNSDSGGTGGGGTEGVGKVCGDGGAASHGMAVTRIASHNSATTAYASDGGTSPMGQIPDSGPGPSAQGPQSFVSLTDVPSVTMPRGQPGLPPNKLGDPGDIGSTDISSISYIYIYIYLVIHVYFIYIYIQF